MLMSHHRFSGELSPYLAESYKDRYRPLRPDEGQLDVGSHRVDVFGTFARRVVVKRDDSQRVKQMSNER